MKRIDLSIFFTAFLPAIMGWQAFAHAETPVNGNKGITFEAIAGNDDAFIHAGCGGDEAGVPACEPNGGDTECNTSLPIMCLRDIQAPVPANLENTQHWSGAIAAFSSPVRGDDFRSIRDADLFCQTQFGQQWRVATFHDGGGGQLIAFGSSPPELQRFWIDIKQPDDSTCWSR